MVKNPPAVQEIQETWVWFLGQEDTLEEEKATYSSIAWKIPWTEEPSRLESKELQRLDMTEWLSTHKQPFFFFWSQDRYGERVRVRLGSLELGSAKSFPLNTGLRKLLGWSPKKNAKAVSRWMESLPKGTNNHRCVLWGPTGSEPRLCINMSFIGGGGLVIFKLMVVILYYILSKLKCSLLKVFTYWLTLPSH